MGNRLLTPPEGLTTGTSQWVTPPNGEVMWQVATKGKASMGSAVVSLEFLLPSVGDGSAQAEGNVGNATSVQFAGVGGQTDGKLSSQAQVRISIEGTSPVPIHSYLLDLDSKD